MYCTFYILLFPRPPTQEKKKKEKAPTHNGTTCAETATQLESSFRQYSASSCDMRVSTHANHVVFSPPSLYPKAPPALTNACGSFGRSLKNTSAPVCRLRVIGSGGNRSVHGCGNLMPPPSPLRMTVGGGVSVCGVQREVRGVLTDGGRSGAGGVDAGCGVR